MLGVRGVISTSSNKSSVTPARSTFRDRGRALISGIQTPYAGSSPPRPPSPRGSRCSDAPAPRPRLPEPRRQTARHVAPWRTSVSRMPPTAAFPSPLELRPPTHPAPPPLHGPSPTFSPTIPYSPGGGLPGDASGGGGGHAGGASVGPSVNDANVAALAPLARHPRTRSAHVAAVSASLMPRTMRPNLATRKDGAHAGHTFFVAPVTSRASRGRMNSMKARVRGGRWRPAK